MKLWVIITEPVPLEILGAEKVPSEQADRYTARLRKLVREGGATFLGRAMEEATGQVFQLFLVEESGDSPAQTVYVQDRQATRVLSTLLVGEGKVRRLKIEGLGPGAG